MNLEQLKSELFKDDGFRKEYLKYDLALEIGEMIIDVRVKKGLTQANLAKLVGTEQPSIARLESGKKLPTLSFLEKIAKALGTHLLAPKFAFLNQRIALVQSVAPTEYNDISYSERMTLALNTPAESIDKNPIPLKECIPGYESNNEKKQKEYA